MARLSERFQVTLFNACLLATFVALSQPCFSYENATDTGNVDVEASRMQVKLIYRHTQVLYRTDAVTLGQYAMFLDKAADRISGLPFLGIDTDILNFRQTVANRLMNIAMMYRDIGMRASLFRNYNTDCHYNTVGNWWYYYHTYWCRTYRDQTERRVATRDAVWFKNEQTTAIKSEMSDLRRKLTERYGVEF